MPRLEIPGEIGQYYCCWCPGSLCRQVTRSHAIDNVGKMCWCFPWVRNSINCAITENGKKKIKYVFRILHIHSAGQLVHILEIWRDVTHCFTLQWCHMTTMMSSSANLQRICFLSCLFRQRRHQSSSFTLGQRKKVTVVTFFPARPRPDQRVTNTGQIRKVPVNELAWFLVYIMTETRSRLSANHGILVCLVRVIWQFKIFAGKEVTALPATHGEGGYWRWGRRLLCLCWNWIALSFFKTLEIKWLRTYHRLVICTNKHIYFRKVAPLNILFEA